MSVTVIELRGVCANLATFNLGPIDFHVAAGEHRLVVGPSGAGKSLLLNVLAGFHRLTAGSVFVRGQDATNLPAAQRRCAWVGQRAALFPHMSVRRNIGFGLRCHGVASDVIDTQVETLATRLELTPWLDRRPGQLSVGEQQRVALARALAPGFEILLLDEPFSALDRGRRMALHTTLMELNRERDLTIVHVTHDVELWSAWPTAAVAMVQGRVVQQGSVQEILRHPAHSALAAALGPVIVC